MLFLLYVISVACVCTSYYYELVVGEDRGLQAPMVLDHMITYQIQTNVSSGRMTRSTRLVH
jgi:hypothetical protein